MPWSLANFRLQAAYHFAGVYLALSERFQIDEHPAAVEGGIGAVHADECRETLDRRVFQDDPRKLLLFLGHRRKRAPLRRLGYPHDQPRVLNREESLRDHDV